MQIEELLTDIGLSDKEAQMYITLLRHGTQPTSYLAKKAGFNRGTGYVILHQLLEKGLAAKSMKKRVQYFSPLEPQNLIEYLDRKQKQIERGRENVELMLGQLAAITNPLTSKPKIEFFDGPEGARIVLQQTLTAKSETLHAFLSIRDLIEFVGPDFYEEYESERVKVGRNLQAIRTEEKDKQAFTLDERMKHHGTNLQEKREIRYAPADLAFPLTMYIFDNKLAIISTKEENFAVVIESAELSKMQTKLFAMLWNSLDQNTVKIGILHSLSGTMAISERSLVDAAMLAVEEINATGGVLGKRIEPIVLDAESDPEKFADEAKNLITKHGVSSVFGGWTSESRKMMKPIFEKYDHLLWYPVEYEGLEQSPNIVYTGAAPNLHIIPAIDYAIEHLGKNFYLVGSDYVYPRCANEIAQLRIAERGGRVVGEAYEKLGGENFKTVVDGIQKHKPDVIINTINGDSNIAFYRQLRKAGIRSKDIPVISFSIGEEEVSRIPQGMAVGDYMSCNYFQSLPNQKNKAFVAHFREKYGKHRVTDDPIEAAYNSVYLFAEAARRADSTNVIDIRDAARGLVLDAPEGEIRVDADNQHVHRTSRIGQVQADGQFTIVCSADSPTKPDPFPKYKSQKEWFAFVQKLYTSWGNHWSKQ